MKPGLLGGAAAALVLAFLLPAAAAPAKPAPKPAAKAAPAAAPQEARLPAYAVKGFRNAHFGQKQAEVTAAIAKDFNIKSADIQHLNVPGDGTTALAITVPQIEPGPGPATVTYIFGKNGNLIHVNVVWLLDNPDTVQRSQLVEAGLKVAAYFETYSWNTGKSARNLPTGPNAVTMFLGRDNAGGVVEVGAQGVSFNHVENGKTVTSPTPSGPARLRIAYASANENSDITTLKPGQF